MFINNFLTAPLKSVEAPVPFLLPACNAVVEFVNSVEPQDPNDEYYTLRQDVAAEIMRHRHYLKGKWILCPFSDYRYSQVVLFLVEFFHILGLKHLTATCIDLGDGAWRFDYDGKTTTVSKLSHGGSFDTPEVTEIMHCCDVVIDNPPFSKFRSIFHWLKDAPETNNNSMFNYKQIA